MIKKIIAALFAITIMSQINMFAQKNIKNVITLDLKNANAIKDNNDVKGYYLFYKADKLKGKEYSYKLVILDENTEKVATKTIIATKYLYLLESAYNKNRLCFKFYDAKEKMVSLIFYDNKGNKVKTKKYEPIKIEKRLITMSISQGTDMTPSIIPVGDIGFLEYRTVRNESDGYILKYFPNDTKNNSWTYKSKTTSKESETLGPLSANNESITSLLATRPSRTSRDVKYYVVNTDIKTGKEIYRYEMKSSKYEEGPINAIYNSKTGNTNLLSYYFKKGDNMMTGRSIGLSNTLLSSTGEEISKKYIGWIKDISKVLPVNKRNKFDDIGFMYFHEFVKGQDGKYYGVAESYKTVNKGSNTGLKVLALASGDAGGMGLVTVKVEDFYIFKFDEDFNFEGLNIFEKSPSKYTIPAWGSSPVLTGHAAKAFGCFDFSDLKVLDQGKSFVIFYQDYEKRKKEKNKSVAGIISNTNGEYVTDKIDIDTDATIVRVMPAIGGSILFLEYFAKEKRIEMNIKKMNY